MKTSIDQATEGGDEPVSIKRPRAVMKTISMEVEAH